MRSREELADSLAQALQPLLTGAELVREGVEALEALSASLRMEGRLQEEAAAREPAAATLDARGLREWSLARRGQTAHARWNAALEAALTQISEGRSVSHGRFTAWGTHEGEEWRAELRIIGDEREHAHRDDADRLTLATAIHEAADEGGIVQAAEARDICQAAIGGRHPEWHETCRMWDLADRLGVRAELAYLVGFDPSR